MSASTPPADFFKKELRLAEEHESKAQRRFNLLAFGRLMAFVGVVVSVWLWNRENASEWSFLTLVAGIAFLILMRYQQTARRQRDFFRHLQTINRDELGRLEFRFSRPETGEQYLHSTHFYAIDLDIFGKHSLFRLLNRTRTDEGSRRLARWLNHPAALEEILMRQEALQEFRPQIENRQTWEATALLHEHSAQQVDVLRAWATEKMDPALQKSLHWRWWPVVTIALGLLALLTPVPGWFFWLSLLWQGLILKRFHAHIQALTSRTTALGHTLLAYADLLQLAHEATYQSRWWKLRKEVLWGVPKTMEALGYWFARLDYRLHPLFIVFVGIPFLWDLHCLAALEAWKKAHRTKLDAWLNALADIEAMYSLAGFAFAHPDYTLPTVAWEENIRIEATQLGHPLISRMQRIHNDFSMVGTGHTLLITGSNMSGKSTFLRTVGINLVMAQMGSVVCAEAFTCAPVQVFSSMRTQDSLVENTSSFYAELKRLRQLLELAGRPSAGNAERKLPVFYLLDEILKGTNSADRHRGAEALIRQLHPLPAAGLVSTHDLELGQWGATQPFVQNFHFRSDVQDGQLHFDYKLHEGICKSFNATELMRMMGIEVGEIN